MNQRFIQATVAALVFSLAGTATLAYAGEIESNGTPAETLALQNAKISLSEAVRTAEAHAQGKAINSGINDENGVVTYQVEVQTTEGKRHDVFVDMQNGKVISMATADDNEGQANAGGNDEGEEREEKDEGQENNNG